MTKKQKPMPWEEVRSLCEDARDMLSGYEHVRAVVEMSGGQLVSQYRKSLGLSQRKMADALGTSHTYLSKVENGKAPMALSLAARLAERFDDIKGEK